MTYSALVKAAVTDINQMNAETEWLKTPVAIAALRAAAMMILLETEGRPTRVVVNIETLIAEARALAASWRSRCRPHGGGAQGTRGC